MFSKIFAITVTYGDRFYLLRNVLDRLLNENVYKIIVVDNGSNPRSRSSLLDYQKSLNDNKLHILLLDKNYGSSVGFKKGIQFALQFDDCDFIWLLDDDNLPENGSLNIIRHVYAYLGSHSKTILTPYRRIKSNNYESVYFGRIFGYRPNAFLGFHIKDYFYKKFFCKKIYILPGFLDKKNFFLIRQQVAPYGGLFFHKSVVSVVGYPDERFFTYADDHEWTMRMTKAGFDICLCSEYKVSDIEVSSPKQDQNQIFNDSFLKYKFYLRLRNHTYLSFKLVDNYLLFYFHIVLFIIFNFFKSIFISPTYAVKKIYFTIIAIRDGIRADFSKDYNHFTQ